MNTTQPSTAPAAMHPQPNNTYAMYHLFVPVAVMFILLTLMKSYRIRRARMREED